MTEGSQTRVQLKLESSDGKYELRHNREPAPAAFWTPRGKNLTAAWWRASSSFMPQWRMRVPEEYKTPNGPIDMLTFDDPSALAQALVDHCPQAFAMQCLAALDIYCASNKIALKLPPVGPVYNAEWNHLYKQWHGQSNGTIPPPVDNSKMTVGEQKKPSFKRRSSSCGEKYGAVEHVDGSYTTWLHDFSTPEAAAENGGTGLWKAWINNSVKYFPSSRALLEALTSAGMTASAESFATYMSTLVVEKMKQPNGEVTLAAGGMCNLADVVHDEVAVSVEDAKKWTFETFRRAAKHISFVGLGADRLTIADEISVRGMWPSFEPVPKHYIPGVIDYIDLVNIPVVTLDIPRRCAHCRCTEGQHRMNCPERTVGYEVSRGAIKAKDMPCLSCDAQIEKIAAGTVISHETTCPRHIRNWRKPKRQWTTVKEGVQKYQQNRIEASRKRECTCLHTGTGAWKDHSVTCPFHYREAAWMPTQAAGYQPYSVLEARSKPTAEKPLVGVGVSAPGAKPLPEIRSPAPRQANDNIDLEDLLCGDAT